MPSSAEPALRARDVHKHFGGLHAVDGMDLDVEAGSLTGVIGPNGAGKSTLFDVLAGGSRATSGTISLYGRDITRLPAHQRTRLGLVRTFQLTRPFARLTVLENLCLAAPNQSGENLFATLLAGPTVASEERAIRERAIETLEFFELAKLKDAYSGSLSGGQKKLLELARALMTEPKIVLLDEPMAGVNPTLARKLMEKIETLRAERGLTFVLIEHDLETVFRHCSPIIVMASGKRLASGSAEEIRANRAVVDAYLGG
ncbi:MAG: ABC transporter ATP-binding protein [Thermoplasmatota archaeon]